MNPALLMIPIGLQALVMGVDEFHFHRHRGLPRWERVGHPVDTASVLACYGVTLVLPPSQNHLAAFVALAALSCILITKDEFVHAQHCSATEQWLHAVLFVLHPVVLAAAALLWWNGETTLLLVQALLIAAFGLYQLLYWNVSWTRPPLRAP